MKGLANGQVFKNYKDLCSFLEWEIAYGNSRKAQLSELNRMCRNHRDGHKIIIDEVYSTKLQTLSKGKYINDIQKLLLHILSREKTGRVELTMNKLMNLLDLVNENYVTCYMERNKLIDKTGIEIEFIDEIYNILSRYRAIVLSALKSLKNKGLIELNINQMINYNVPIYDTLDDGSFVCDINGDKRIIGYEKVVRYADAETVQFVLKIKENEIERLSIKDKRCFFINRELEALWRRNVNKELKKYNINYMFQCYEVIYNYESVERQLSRSEVKEIRDRLNKNVLDRVFNAINKYSDNNTLPEEVYSLIECGLYTQEEVKNILHKDILKANPTYKDKCCKIARLLIDRNVRTRDKIPKKYNELML